MKDRTTQRIRANQPNRTDHLKRYIETEYSKFWLEKVHQYGFLPYHDRLLKLITSLASPDNRVLLEIGVGVGWPIAEALMDQNYTVYGVDLAQRLIQEAQVRLGKDRCLVGDAEALPCADSLFDLVYCLQSSWYFPNKSHFLAEMVRVTRPGGVMIFDVMNFASKLILLSKIRKYSINFGRNIYRQLSGQPLLPLLDHERPTSPWQINKILNSLPVSWQVVLPEDLQRTASGMDYFHYRLVYICRKQDRDAGPT